MIIEITAGLLLAMVPNLMMVWNLLIFKELKGDSSASADRSLSILIPARNESENIEGVVDSIIEAGFGSSDEIIFYDDQSDDGTGELLLELSRAQRNLRIANTKPLPQGWNGKQHACARLAGEAENKVLVFMDADVRLEPGALDRLRSALDERCSSLVSGVPRQITHSFWERALIPQIFVLLLGYLPLAFARKWNFPALAAGCGQIFIADRDAYRRMGGHEMIKNSRHDGLKLPAAFRRSGFRTDVVDLSRLARCRMYDSRRAVFSGLLKNATEGMGSKSAIGPMTVLLLGGQVAPILALAIVCGLYGVGFYLALTAILLAFLPRLLVGFRFQQRPMDTWMQPMAICVLVCIQWIAVLREAFGYRVSWKGRD